MKHNTRKITKNLIQKVGLRGRVLCVTSVNDFWCNLLKEMPSVNSVESVTDQELTVYNPDWENRFDWVWCMDVCQLYQEQIDVTPFRHICKYAFSWITIHYTRNDSSCWTRFHHKVKDLESSLSSVLTNEQDSYTCWYDL